MKARSAKNKGRKLQTLVRDRLRSVYTEILETNDIESQVMGMSGEDIVLSPAAKRIIPYSFECKNQERINVWKALEQAESNCDERTPVVIIKRNRSKVYALMEAEEWVNLIRSKYAISVGEGKEGNKEIARESGKDTK